MMRRQLIYDLPTRLFHWLFAGLFLAAFLVASFAEHSAAFPYHMLAGIILTGLVLFRLTWGLVGTRYARFGSFELKPGSLFQYFRSMFGSTARHWAGHNPASSWSAIAMFALAVGLGVTGYLMVGAGQKERYEDVHELLANSFLVVALLHVAGVVLHTLRHRDQFPRAMIDGRKVETAAGEGITRARPVAGVAMLAAVAALGIYLLRGYDPGVQELRAFGTSFSLGEREGDREYAARAAEAPEAGHDDDD